MRPSLQPVHWRADVHVLRVADMSVAVGRYVARYEAELRCASLVVQRSGDEFGE